MNVQNRLKIKIGPSILKADLSNLSSECSGLLKNGADYIHLDVMDGHFVPNLTFGAPLVKCLRKKIPKPGFFDMHMMVSEPEKWIRDMEDAGADQYVFHVEATQNPAGCIRKIKETGMLAGIAVKPKTDVTIIDQYLDDVDLVLIMTVEPGFGGQKFMHDMMPKISHVRSKKPSLEIEVDGGVNTENVSLCCKAGANQIVSGSAVTDSPTPAQVIAELKANGEAAFCSM